MRVKVVVTGIVQGVGFRPFIYRMAVKNGLNGYVRNRGDAGVEAVLEGEERRIDRFLRDLNEEKPPLAAIDRIVTSTLHGKDRYQVFKILKSSEKAEVSGSIVPSDIALCNRCLEELRNHDDPRHRYFFITCTDCGPRYTIIERLPYDRSNTTMQEFPMCSFCESEYRNPSNRRFHAQSVACPRCGPKAWLETRRGEPCRYDGPIEEAGKLISEGSIIAVKGYGGFHIAASTVNDDPLTRIRQVKHRTQKPFALMAPDLEQTRSFAEVSPAESKLLTSHARPIVVLNKSEDYYLSDLIAPGLHNVGVMLPYSAMHHMLFDRSDEPAFVMTSANPPNEPVIKDNEEASRRLCDTVDYFLLHDRVIAQRCDDSVVRRHGNSEAFLRRSRGYAPAPILLNDEAAHCTLGLGGELNNTCCIVLKNKAFVSQHIGDIQNVETRDFLESTVGHLVKLTNSKIETIASDMHPGFVTTKLADDLSVECGWRPIRVQHHQAHIAGLMFEGGVEEIVGICCDGYGYGNDGEAWGGEILYCNRESMNFERLGHLQKQPLIGGDLATIYPLRVAAGILGKSLDIQDWLLKNQQCFPHGGREVETILQHLHRNTRTAETSSCGRVLDAVSAILGICCERTYEGEPAMKLESAAVKARDILQLEPIITGNVLDTTRLVVEIFRNKSTHTKADLAYSAHTYLARGLANIAIKEAIRRGVKTIGFSGGVACNRILAITLQKMVEGASLNFASHRVVPPGDGGLSFGQAVVAGFSQP